MFYNIRKIDLRPAFSVKGIQVDLIPLKKPHVYGHPLFYPANLYRRPGITHHSQGGGAQLRYSRAFKGIIGAAAVC